MAEALEPWVKQVLKLLYIHRALKRRKHLHLSIKRETTLSTRQLIERTDDGRIKLTTLGREIACELMGKP